MWYEHRDGTNVTFDLWQLCEETWWPPRSHTHTRWVSVDHTELMIHTSGWWYSVDLASSSNSLISKFCTRRTRSLGVTPSRTICASTNKNLCSLVTFSSSPSSSFSLFSLPPLLSLSLSHPLPSSPHHGRGQCTVPCSWSSPPVPPGRSLLPGGGSEQTTSEEGEALASACLGE